MKHLMLVLLVASVCLAEKQAESARQATLKGLNWAFPMPDNARPGGDDKPLQHVPGSTSTYTEEQINPFNPRDWVPDERPAVPEVVRHCCKVVDA